MKLNCLIIDDEPIARKLIIEYISEVDFLTLCGVASNPVKASDSLSKGNIDLILLDVQMPKLNGIQFLRNSTSLPLVIMTTAFPQYALEGYELDVIDYLVKPIPFERFYKACNKAKAFYDRRGNQHTGHGDFFFVRCENMYEKIFYSDLLFVEAANNYVYLQTKERRLIAYLTFKSIEESLPKEHFIKVHKSFIVSLPEVSSLNSEEIKIGNFSIPISRNMKEEIMATIVNKNLIRR
ncbi:MAG: response regulator transcription factor [Flavipsychrobacter sp.]|nr:response regulator transcription factor [Flavipsychrobacter sp.]